MINEISPPVVRGKTGSIVQIIINVGVFSLAAMAMAFPHHASYITEDGNNVLWRVIIGFQILLALIAFIVFFSCYNFDTPLKYVEKGEY